MEIKDKLLTFDAEAHVNKTPAKEKNKLPPPQQSPGVPPTEDNVVLSPKAQQVGEARRLLKASPEVREELVAHLRKKIKAGTYQVDGARVASRMTKDALLHEVLLDKTEEQ